MNSQWLIVGTAVGWLALFVGIFMNLAYRRAALPMSTCILLLLFAAYWIFGAAPLAWKIAVSLPFAVLLLLNVRPLRVALVTRPFMRKYRKLLPTMSATEREALDAGTVWWDGELFTGAPNWQKLMSAQAPALTAAEQAFLDGPCEELCAMLDDWDITHRRADMPASVWAFIKSRGFFAMIIPRRYGGLEFSAYAHSCVLIKIASRSTTASSTIADSSPIIGSSATAASSTIGSLLAPASSRYSWVLGSSSGLLSFRFSRLSSFHPSSLFRHTSVVDLKFLTFWWQARLGTSNPNTTLESIYC